MRYGSIREDLTLQPVSGKGLPVYGGEVLRIIQVEGEQCVDFNAFNLNDYKEFMSASNTRAYHGFRPKQGDMLWSVHSRNRPMYLILEMKETCFANPIGGRCKASLHYSDGFTPETFGIHTNCQDTFAVSVGEYGLSPDDVHDSFNMWMNLAWDSTGQYWITWNTGVKGDYVDLLANFDTLAVPIVCGSGDTSVTSNYALKPIQVQVFESSEETKQLVETYEKRYGRAQRTPDSFKVKGMRAERELRRDPDYVPEFVNFPITTRRIPVELGEEQYERLQRLKASGVGKTDAEALRAAFFMWYHRNRRQMPLQGKLRQN